MYEIVLTLFRTLCELFSIGWRRNPEPSRYWSQSGAWLVGEPDTHTHIVAFESSQGLHRRERILARSLARVLRVGGPKSVERDRSRPKRNIRQLTRRRGGRTGRHWLFSQVYSFPVFIFITKSGCTSNTILSWISWICNVCFPKAYCMSSKNKDFMILTVFAKHLKLIRYTGRGHFLIDSKKAFRRSGPMSWMVQER